MKVITVGNGKTTVGVVGGQHGNEILGFQVINRLIRREPEPQLRLKLVIANEVAINENRRFLESDLNRSFPGKLNGTAEEQLAYQIKTELSDCKYVLDIYSTFAAMSSAIVVTSKTVEKPEVKYLIDKVPIRNVLVMNGKNLGDGSSLIDYTNAGVGLEFSRRSTIWHAFSTVNTTLKNIASSKSAEVEKFVLSVDGFIDKCDEDKIRMENFKLVKKGDVIIRRGHVPIIAESDFYPIFVGEIAYKGKACMIAKRT